MHLRVLLWRDVSCQGGFKLSLSCSFHLPSQVEGMVSCVGCSIFFLILTPFFASTFGRFLSIEVGFFFSREFGLDRKCRVDVLVESFGGVGLRERRGCDILDCLEEFLDCLDAIPTGFLFLGIIQN